MIIMMKPTVSSYFNVDDIRKIREYNSNRYENMTSEEIIADIKRGSDNVRKRLNERGEGEYVQGV